MSALNVAAITSIETVPQPPAFPCALSLALPRARLLECPPFVVGAFCITHRQRRQPLGPLRWPRRLTARSPPGHRRFFLAPRLVQDYVEVPRIIGRVLQVPALVTVVAIPRRRPRAWRVSDRLSPADINPCRVIRAGSVVRADVSG